MNDMVLVERLVEDPVKEEMVGSIIMPAGTMKAKHGPELAELLSIGPANDFSRGSIGKVFILQPLALAQGIQVEGNFWLISFKNIAAVLP